MRIRSTRPSTHAQAPQGPWVMAMEWRDLLFAHWPVPAAALRGLIPPALELQTFDGTAWIGVVPFRMTNVRPRMVPSIPWISHFAELNLRTYVTAGGKPGVWFFSLDAANPIAVRLARAGFHLPYFDARMHCHEHHGVMHYSSIRTHHKAPGAALRMSYRPNGPVYYSQPGTLEHWLTERYYLYAANKRGHVLRGGIRHIPWPLQPAEAEFKKNEMTFQIGLRCPTTQPLLHFARYQHVVAWLPELVTN